MREPWNAAGNLWHRARNAVAPRKRVVPKPIVSEKQAGQFMTPLLKGQAIVRQDGAFVDCVCQECGHNICGCDQRWEMAQEKQRAALAPSPEELRNAPAPWLRPSMPTREQRDRARMSLGYGERDYDQARRVNIALMQNEMELLQKRCRLEADSLGFAPNWMIDRIGLLEHAIRTHEARLPRTIASHQYGMLTPAQVRLITTGRMEPPATDDHETHKRLHADLAPKPGMPGLEAIEKQIGNLFSPW